ncbi:MAG: flippase-like domain-containing protein [Planctomycetes bacterium]|nr:flippase-like domain-containing protein [Planctomycetota bacterium]
MALPSSSSRQARPRARIAFTLSLALGLGLLVCVFAWVGTDEVWAALSRAGAGATLSLLANGLAILLLQTVAWGILLRSAGDKVPFPVLVNAMFMGFAMAFLTPSMYLGGEPIRMFYVAARRKLPKRRVLGTILVHKFQELSAFLAYCWLGSGAAVLLYGARLGTPLLVFLVAFDLLVGAALGALLWSFLARARWSARLLSWFAERGWWRPAFFSRAAVAASDMEDLIHEAFVRRLPATLLSHLLMFASLTLVFLRPLAFFAWVPGAKTFAFSTLGVFFVLTQLIMALQFTPGGVGLYEGGFLFIFRLLGLTDPEGLAYTVVARVVELALTGTGVAIGVHLGLLRGLAPAPAVVEAQKEASAGGEPAPANGPASELQ